MDRRTRTLIALAVAVLTATIATFVVYRALSTPTAAEASASSPLTLVVAARALPIGARIAESDVKVVPWPAATPVAGSHRSPEAVVGRGLLAGVAENEPLTEARLAPVEAGAGLPPAITPGMRAISVKVNEVVGVAGFVTPGTRVDVALTVRNAMDVVSRLLVTNVQVLAAGTRYDQETARDGKPIPSTVVTLMVTPEEAERIALASAEGQMTLMLRNPLDTDEPRTRGVRLAQLVQSDGIAAAPAATRRVRASVRRASAPAGARQKGYRVETIAGGKRTQEIVQ